MDNRQRFWEKIKTVNDCWEWQSSLAHNGYGQFTINNRTCLAHRVSYSYAYGEIPTGQNVLHKCDNRRCVNPSHLFLGSYSDNMRDCVLKGRHNNCATIRPDKLSQGERHHFAKLKQSDVENIRNLRLLGFTLSKIADQFGVVKGTIQAICKGKTWKRAR